MNTRKLFFVLGPCLVLVAAVLIGACSSNVRESAGGFTPEIQPLPAGLTTYEAMVIPADNPMTPEKVALDAAADRLVRGYPRHAGAPDRFRRH